MFCKANSAQVEMKAARPIIPVPSNWVGGPKKPAPRDSVQSMSFRHCLAAVSELPLSYVKKDTNRSDHNQLLYVFLYLQLVICVSGNEPVVTQGAGGAGMRAGQKVRTCRTYYPVEVPEVVSLFCRSATIDVREH
jgi:hypothetical protein